MDFREFFEKRNGYRLDGPNHGTPFDVHFTALSDTFAAFVDEQMARLNKPTGDLNQQLSRLGTQGLMPAAHNFQAGIDGDYCQACGHGLNHSIHMQNAIAAYATGRAFT